MNSLTVDQKLTRKEKVLKFLKETSSKEVSNDVLILWTGIDKSNMSKVLKPLEAKGLIHRRYEQVGRAKKVWISLTNSQSDKKTNSHAKTTNSREKATNSQLNNEKNGLNEHYDHKEMTNSQSDKATNSHSKTTNSQFNNDNYENNELNEHYDHKEMTNSQSDKETNSQSDKETNSHSKEKNTDAPEAINFSIHEHIKIVWKDLAPSITSVFSKRKWPAKYSMFTIFKNWMEELLNV